MSAEAELLRRAAALVRERGEASHARGPFFVKGRCLCEDDEEWERRCNHRLSSWRVRTEVPHDPTIISYEVAQLLDAEDDARWIALMSPVVAEPLAAWLDDEADSAEKHCPGWRYKRPDGWDGEYGDPWIERPLKEYEGFVRGAFGRSLDLARALLGEVTS